MAVKTKLRRAAGGADILAAVPAPVTTADKVVIEIRKFIAGAIFFNTKAADKIGLSLTDMQMIHVLQLYGPATPSRLGEWSGLSSGGVTVALDRLEKAGYIRREPNPADRRSLLVTLAPVRMRKVGAMYEEVERETRERLATLSEKELEVVVRFFERLREARPGRGA
ncbi:MAG TPA: MarR family transcriptional regulator [Acidobacteriaceae bacterium]